MLEDFVVVVGHKQSEFVLVQQSLQPKLSRRRYASVLYALQNNTVFRRAQNWVSVSDGSRTDNGSEFQSVEPETAKQAIIVSLFSEALHRHWNPFQQF